MRDGELVEAVRAGNGEAFGALVQRHQGAVCRLCYQVTGNVAEAEELAHDAFVEAYLKLHQLRDPEKFAPWLRAVALNLCRLWYRRIRRERVEPLPEVAVATEAEPSLSAQVCRGLGRLSPSHRLALVLQYWEGLSYAEIARFLDLPVGTVMSRLHRARRELKRWIEEVSDEEEMSVLPDAEFQREVEAEVNVLLTIYRDDPKAGERLAVLLNRSPERLAALIRESADERALADLALLQGRLGRPAMEVVLACYGSGEPRVRERAGYLLRVAVAGERPRRHTLPAARVAWREAYLLVDGLNHSELPAEGKAGLLLDLMLACRDERTVLLLIHALLCDPDAAFPVLMERFWGAETPQALYRSSDLLYALCRLGTRFARELLEPLRSADPCARAVALAGAEGFAGSLTHSGLELDALTDEEVALDARLRRNWAPPLRPGRDPEVCRALPAIEPCDEPTLSRLVSRVCADWASTRRYLVDEGLMRRDGGIYELTELGQTVWRVERFIQERYLR